MTRENANVPPSDPLLAWVLAELERMEAEGEHPQTQFTNEQGTSIE